jgi:hypothetical protein
VVVVAAEALLVAFLMAVETADVEEMVLVVAVAVLEDMLAMVEPVQ